MAHVFEEFFGLEDEPAKSVKMKVETGPGYLEAFHEFALCSFQFRFALRVSVMFHCVKPYPQKNVNPNYVQFRLKARGLLPSNSQLLRRFLTCFKRFDLLQTIPALSILV